MAQWAPYRTCPQCGSGYWVPPIEPFYWGQAVEPRAEQDASWAGRHELRDAVVGSGGGRRLLDVGCGFGHFVKWSLDRGWDAWGVEQDAWARERTRAPGRVFAEVGEVEAPFDAITLWDVLEHVERPLHLCESMRRLLKPGGFLMVCSPNFAAMQLRWEWLRRDPRRFNGLVRPIEHWTQFTEKGLQLTLERSGFKGVEFVRPPLAHHRSPLLNRAVTKWPALRVGLFARGYAR